MRRRCLLQCILYIIIFNNMFLTRILYYDKILLFCEWKSVPIYSKVRLAARRVVPDPRIARVAIGHSNQYVAPAVQYTIYGSKRFAGLVFFFLSYRHVEMEISKNLTWYILLDCELNPLKILEISSDLSSFQYVLEVKRNYNAILLETTIKE